MNFYDFTTAINNSSDDLRFPLSLFLFQHGQQINLFDYLFPHHYEWIDTWVIDIAPSGHTHGSDEEAGQIEKTKILVKINVKQISWNWDSSAPRTAQRNQQVVKRKS